MRAPTNKENKIQGTKKGKQQEEKKQLTDSFLAMGLVLNVFPQLDAVISEPKRFEQALQCIFGAFESEQPFLHIIKEGKNVLKLKQEGTIHEFLRGELSQQFATDDTVKDIVDKCSESTSKKHSS